MTHLPLDLTFQHKGCLYTNRPPRPAAALISGSRECWYPSISRLTGNHLKPGTVSYSSGPPPLPGLVPTRCSLITHLVVNFIIFSPFFFYFEIISHFQKSYKNTENFHSPFSLMHKLLAFCHTCFIIFFLFICKHTIFLIVNPLRKTHSHQASATENLSIYFLGTALYCSRIKALYDVTTLKLYKPGNEALLNSLIYNQSSDFSKWFFRESFFWVKIQDKVIHLIYLSCLFDLL